MRFRQGGSYDDMRGESAQPEMDPMTPTWRLTVRPATGLGRRMSRDL